MEPSTKAATKDGKQHGWDDQSWFPFEYDDVFDLNFAMHRGGGRRVREESLKQKGKLFYLSQYARRWK